MTHYRYEKPFRMKILALMLNNLWMGTYGDALILPEYFETQEEEAFVKSVMDYRKAFHRSPTDSVDAVALADPSHGEFFERIFDIYESEDLALAAREAIQFAQEQAVKLAILESIDEVNQGNLAAPHERMIKAMEVGTSLISPGIDPIRDTDKWLYEYWADKVKTGLTHLDKNLEGGLGVPELGIVMGPPNGGKSTVLVNIGFGAAGLGSGKNVVHFTHEMKVAQVAKRYAARLTFKFPQRGGNLSEYEDELLAAARKLLKGKIRIIGGSKMTTEEIRMHVRRLIAEGFEPGLIIDDYPDLIVPSRRYNERRFELSAIYEDCRAMSEEFNVPFWGATQANRESLSKEIITMANIAEDLGKAAIADVIVAICQTFEEKQNHQCRLFTAKVRDSSSMNPLIACKYYPEKMAIISTGYAQIKDKKEDTNGS